MRQQVERVVIAGQRQPVAIAHQRLVESDVGGRQRLPVAFQPVDRGIHPRLAVDEADAPVAECGQMRRRREAARDLARQDRNVLARLGIAVEQHRRHILQRLRQA